MTYKDASERAKERILKSFSLSLSSELNDGYIEFGQFLIDLNVYKYDRPPMSIQNVLRWKLVKSLMYVLGNQDYIFWRKGTKQPKLVHPSFAFLFIYIVAPELVISVWSIIRQKNY